MDEPDKPKRTAAATSTLMRRREEKAADLLVSRPGWKVISPEGEDWEEVRLRQSREADETRTL